MKCSNLGEALHKILTCLLLRWSRYYDHDKAPGSHTAMKREVCLLSANDSAWSLSKGFTEVCVSCVLATELTRSLKHYGGLITDVLHGIHWNFNMRKQLWFAIYINDMVLCFKKLVPIFHLWNLSMFVDYSVLSSLTDNNLKSGFTKNKNAPSTKLVATSVVLNNKQIKSGTRT